MFAMVVALAVSGFAQASTPTAPLWIDETLSLKDFNPRLEDWYYPAEEPAQRAALKVPLLSGIEGREVSLTMAADALPTRVPVGGEFHGWRVVETLSEPQPIAVLERDFERWGLIVFQGKRQVVAEIRKAVGSLPAIQRPSVRFPADYFRSLRAAQEDLLAAKVLRSKPDPAFEDLAGCLAPLQTYTLLGSPESTEKWIVEADGTIGHLPVRWGSGKRLEKTLFDPRAALGLEERSPKSGEGKTAGAGPLAADPTRIKHGLLGGYLPAVNYGVYDLERQAGWELLALVDEVPKPSVLVRLRRSDGPTDYYQLEPLRKLPDGKPLFAALLRLHESWQRFFARGMQVEVNDRRALDAARTGIARAISGCVILHPKYGMGAYWGKQHDGFPPTTLSLGTCLLEWGLFGEFRARLGYYLDHFVKADGTFNYYGPALAEYGELLDLAAAYVRRTGDAAWFLEHRPAVDRIVDRLLDLRAKSRQSQAPDALTCGLLHGSAEADTADQRDYYLSGNVWCWRGIQEVGNVLVEIGRKQGDDRLVRRGERLLAEAKAFRADILRAVERSVVGAGAEKFLAPIVGHKTPFRTMTQDTLASYTNYRYWPEALSAGCLPAAYAQMILDYRSAHGGEILAMTRFAGHLDDWPFYHQAQGLLANDRVSLYVLGYYAHMALHQTPGTFTAYEQVPIEGYGFRREVADYCVPSQLTIPIMTRWMLVAEERDAEVLWLCRAVPRAWLANKLAVRGAPTRWGPVGLEIEPAADLQRFTARLSLSSENGPAIHLRIRHPERKRIADCQVTGGRCDQIDAQRELVRLTPTARGLTVVLTFAPPRVP